MALRYGISRTVTKQKINITAPHNSPNHMIRLETEIVNLAVQVIKNYQHGRYNVSRINPKNTADTTKDRQ